MRVDAARRLPAGATLTAATPVTEAFGKSLTKEKETPHCSRSAQCYPDGRGYHPVRSVASAKSL
jgi:hypothetical protein